MTISSRITDLSIRSKITLGFLALIMVMLCDSVLVDQKVRSIQYALAVKTQAREVIGSVQDVMTATAGQESSLRGLRLASDPSLLASYRQQQSDFAAAFARAGRLAAADAVQRSRLQQLGRLADAWNGQVAHGECGHWRDGGRPRQGG